VRVSSTPDGSIRAVGDWVARFVFSNALKQQLERLVGTILRARGEQQSPSIQVVSTLNVVCRNIICFKITKTAWLNVINAAEFKRVNYVWLTARRVMRIVKRRSEHQAAPRDDEIILWI
jgi:hypothetical protein